MKLPFLDEIDLKAVARNMSKGDLMTMQMAAYLLKKPMGEVLWLHESRRLMQERGIISPSGEIVPSRAAEWSKA